MTDAAGVRTMTYDEDTLQLVSEAIAGTGGLINRTITRDYSAADDSAVRRRPIGLHVGTDEYVTTWSYDDTGRPIALRQDQPAGRGMQERPSATRVNRGTSGGAHICAALPAPGSNAKRSA